MTATTATTPWDGAAETLIRESTEHLYTVRFYTGAGVEITGLFVTSCVIRLDEYWSPYLQGTITIVLPSAAALAALDPRLRVTVRVSAGYVLPGGASDIHPLAVGYLARRTIDQPADEVTLEIAGAEYLYDGWRDLTGNDWYPALWNASKPARDAINDCLVACRAVVDTTGWDYAGALTTTGWAGDPPDVWVPGQGDPAMDFARDIAGRIEGWFRCDELGTWRLSSRPVTGSDADVVHYIRAGADGTLISSQAALSRDGWANAVLVKYVWADQYAYGSAAVTTGAYATSQVGVVVQYQEYPWKGAQVHAVNRAKAALKQLIGKGFAYTVDAVAAYWIRPTDFVSLDLGVETPVTPAFVSSITFDLDAGRMSITTRQPIPNNTTL